MKNPFNVSRKGDAGQYEGAGPMAQLIARRSLFSKRLLVRIPGLGGKVTKDFKIDFNRSFFMGNQYLKKTKPNGITTNTWRCARLMLNCYKL